VERKWSIRAYREGDEEGIFELWKAVYPQMKYDRDRWMRWWQSKFKGNPAGDSILWIADHGGKIVGQFSIIPVRMKVGNEIIVAGLDGDTMTHPDYQRQGVAGILGNRVHAEAEKKGINVVYGFPNEANRLVHIKKLDWFDFATMRFLMKPLNWGNALKLRIKNKFLLKLGAIGGNLLVKVFYRTKKAPIVEGLTIYEIPSFDERINEFWDRVSGQHRIMMVRNSDYLNWGYAIAQNVDYSIYIAEKAGQINGYLVLGCGERLDVKVGVILDILAQSAQITQCLVARAVEHCRQEKVDLVYGNMVADKTYLRAFRKNGFIYLPFIKDPFCGRSTSQDIPKEFLMDAKNWFVQIGDSI